MWLNSLGLQPYGSLSDVTLEFGDGLNVVYGLNEAGKSTLLSAYADLLCGIPRQTPMQFQARRARLVLHASVTTDDGSTIQVSRTSKNAPNDLLDTATSNPVSGQARQALTQGLNHDSLRSRFGLDHDRLVTGGRQLMKGQGGLADIVFEARSGADVRVLIAGLEARENELYKSRKNSVSELMQAKTRRDQLDAELTETLATAEAVEAATTKQTQAKAELDRCRLEAARQRAEHARLVQLVESWPYWVQYRARGDELAQVEAGGRRLSPEQLRSVTDEAARLEEIGGEVGTQSQVVEQEQLNRSGLAVDDNLLGVQPAIDTLAKDKHRADEAKTHAAELARDATEARAEIVKLLGRLGRNADADPLAALSTLAVPGDRVADLNDLAAEGDRLDEAMRTAQQSVEDAAAAVEAAERAAETARPSGEHPDAVDPTQVGDAREHREALWGHVRRSWLTGQDPPAEIGPGLEALADRYEASVAGTDAAADELIAEAGQLSQQQRTEIEAAATAQATVSERRRALTKTEQAIQDVAGMQDNWHSRWQATAEAAGLPSGLGIPGWRERAALLSEAQAAADNLSDLERDRAGKAQTAADWDARVSALAADLGRAVAAEQLVAWFDETMAAHAQSKSNQQAAEVHRQAQDNAIERIAQLREELATRQHSLDQVAAECEVGRGELEALAERARAYAVAEAALEGPAAELRARHPELTLEELTGQLADRDREQLDVDAASAQETLQRVEEDVDAAQNAAFEAKKELDELTGRTGSDTLQQQLSQVNALVLDIIEDYATVRLMHHLLTQELHAYLESNRNPVLERAGSYLSRLTQGRFTALRADGEATDRSLIVVGADDADNETSGLSEGTASQLYLALSLAGVLEVEQERRQAGQETVPIMLDDVLMAFDDQRAADALDLLAEIAAEQQIVLFTHHGAVKKRADCLGEAVRVLSLDPPVLLE